MIDFSDIMERLLKDGVLSRASKDRYTVNQVSLMDCFCLPISYDVILLFVKNVLPSLTRHMNVFRRLIQKHRI